MLDRGLRIVVTASRRTSKLERRSGVERDDPIIGSAHGDSGITKHRRRRVSAERATIRARGKDIRGQRVRWETGIGRRVVRRLSVGLQSANVSVPRRRIDHVVA